MKKITTVIKQHREETPDGADKLITVVRMGAREPAQHVVNLVEYASNGGYYIGVGGNYVTLAQAAKLFAAANGK